MVRWRVLLALWDSLLADEWESMCISVSIYMCFMELYLGVGSDPWWLPMCILALVIVGIRFGSVGLAWIAV